MLDKIVPSKQHRLLIRKLRVGMIGDTRVRVARQHWQSHLSNICPHCEGVPQTAPHVLLECPIGAEMRAEVSNTYMSCTSSSSVGPGVTFPGVLNHLLSNRSPIPKVQDKVLRNTVLPKLQQHCDFIREQLCLENSIYAEEGSHPSYSLEL